MIKIAGNMAVGLAVTLGFFLCIEGISGVEPPYKQTEPLSVVGCVSSFLP